MSDLQKEIDLLKARLDELEGRNKCGSAEPVKWQPKGGDWYVGYGGVVVESTTASSSRAFGLERATQTQAKRASVEMRRFNRLLALRDELCGDEVMSLNWINSDKEKHNLCFSHNRGKWLVSADFSCERIAPYFTNHNLAQKACDMLNSGEVEL